MKTARRFLTVLLLLLLLTACGSSQLTEQSFMKRINDAITEDSGTLPVLSAESKETRSYTLAENMTLSTTFKETSETLKSVVYTVDLTVSPQYDSKTLSYYVLNILEETARGISISELNDLYDSLGVAVSEKGTNQTASYQTISYHYTVTKKALTFTVTLSQ